MLRRSSLLAGAGSVGGGVLWAGLFTYLFLSLAGRVLGPARFTPVSTLWAVVFILGPGLFLPVQQELGRLLAAQRPLGGGRRAVERVALLAAVVAATTVGVTVAAGRWLADELFDGDQAMVWCLAGSVVAYALTFTARGVLSGLGDYVGLGRLIASESLTRLLLAGGATLAGFRTPAAFGAAIAVAPLVSTAIVTRGGRRHRLEPGPAVSWRAALGAVGWLAAGSLLAQALANAGPLAVQLLADAPDAGRAGPFLSALVIARLGLYLFQAVQATLLPNVASLVAQGRIREAAAALRRLSLACGVLVAVSTVLAWLLGPFAVRVLFGAGFDVTRATMALLTGASGIYLLAAALAAAAVAAAGHRLVAAGWAAGCAAFAVGLVSSDDLFLRVELGYLLGSTVAAGVLGVGVARRLGQLQPVAPGSTR